MSIQEHLNKIRNAIYGREVRESIAKGIETAYNDASEKHDNANMEVKLARGTKPNLNARLDDMEQTDQEVTSQLAQTETKKLNRNENESVNMSMLATDIKEALNGGVWDVNINTSEIEDGAVTKEKLAFDTVDGTVGKNKYNKNDPSIQNGVFVNNTNGIIYANENYETYTMFVVPNETITISHCDQTAFYDNDGVYLSGVSRLWSNGAHSFQVPSSAVTMKTSVRSAIRDAYQIEYNTAPTSYEPYRIIINELSLPNYLRNDFTPEITYTRKSILEITNGIEKGNITRIKLIGDSITNGVGGSNYDTNGEQLLPGKYVNVGGYCWANELKEYIEEKYPSVEVLNHGISGTTTTQVRTNRNTLINENDDLVIVMLGTNDRQLNDLTTTKNNLIQIGDHIRSMGNNVLFMSSVPASIDNESTFNIHMDDINNVVRAVSNHYNQEFVSLYNHFIQYCEWNNVSIDSLLADGLHPNDDGYKVMYHDVMRELGFGIKRPGATW